MLQKVAESSISLTLQTFCQLSANFLSTFSSGYRLHPIHLHTESFERTENSLRFS